MSESGEGMERTDTDDVADVTGQEHERSQSGDKVSLRVDREPRELSESNRELVFDVGDLALYYGDFLAVRHVTLPIYPHHITALIGPSRCGKTTFLRCLNRMN